MDSFNGQNNLGTNLNPNPQQGGIQGMGGGFPGMGMTNGQNPMANAQPVQQQIHLTQEEIILYNTFRQQNGVNGQLSQEQTQAFGQQILFRRNQNVQTQGGPPQGLANQNQPVQMAKPVEMANPVKKVSILKSEKDQENWILPEPEGNGIRLVNKINLESKSK